VRGAVIASYQYCARVHYEVELADVAAFDASLPGLMLFNSRCRVDASPAYQGWPLPRLLALPELFVDWCKC
jgi:hypothetical protein